MASDTIDASVINQKVTDEYALYHGDCVRVLNGIASRSVHFSISSPPFSQLYNYSDAAADMSNVRTDAEFMDGMGFMVEELSRIMMPGRILAFHCMQIPAMKERDGYIGLKDFRGDLIRLYQHHGFIYHSEVLIWKDPLIEATRTKALGLMHKQLVKDSAICRVGSPDYLVVMRKRGNNPEPISHLPSGFDRWIGAEENAPRVARSADPGKNKYSHEVWQRYASPTWLDVNQSDTLQKASAREDSDSRHICPMSLTVIRRAMELWSNPGDIVLDPFAGIGSAGYVALQEGRKFVGAELKESYWAEAVRNLDSVLESRSQAKLMLTEEEPCQTWPTRK